METTAGGIWDLACQFFQQLNCDSALGRLARIVVQDPDSHPGFRRIELVHWGERVETCANRFRRCDSRCDEVIRSRLEYLASAEIDAAKPRAPADYQHTTVRKQSRAMVSASGEQRRPIRPSHRNGIEYFDGG
jgi:hypothetical protein